MSLLLTDAEGAGGKVAEQFRYILVDEYQDTNRLQAQLIRPLARGHHNVMVVGDDSQSIYAFRRADIEAYEHVVKQVCGQDETLKLQENFTDTT